jgi:intracellular septation protein
MQALLELAPLVAFFVAYYFGGISPMHALSAVLVFALGAATLLLHDKHFIQLKPTVLFWFAGLAFLASFWFGKQTITERLFTAALQGQVKVSQRLWRQMNALWVVFYGLLGGANLLIARYATERVWVYSKIGLTVLTFIFAIAQVLYLVKRGEPAEKTPQPESETPTPVQEPPAA